MNSNLRPLRAFTLIELLIVVAIIAILAAIAVPNFLEAQTRSKVSRTKADMRTMATALESYVVDYNKYPACHRFGVLLRPDVSEPEVLERLTTPIAYITSITQDPFKVAQRYSAATALAISQANPTPVSPANDLAAALNSYIYQAFSPENRSQTQADAFAPAFVSATGWILHSAGPDSSYHNLGGVLANDADIDGPILLIYDPTNGTVSFGSIYRAGGATGAGPTYAGGSGLFQAIQTQN